MPKTAEATKPTMTLATKSERTRAIIARAIDEMARPEQTAEEMALAILEATSLDEILGSTVAHLADLVGQSFYVLSASLNKSDYEEGIGVFAVLDTIQSNGSRAVVTTGATNVVAQLIAMHAGDHYPSWVKVMSDTTKAGYTVFKLGKSDVPAPTQQQLAAWGESF